MNHCISACLTATMALSVTTTGAAQAAAETTIAVRTAAAYDLPSQPLGDALKAVGALAKINVLIQPELVDGRQAPALKANLTVDQAITRLLVGTGITFRYLSEKTIVLSANKPTAQVAEQEFLRMAWRESSSEPQSSQATPSQGGTSSVADSQTDADSVAKESGRLAGIPEILVRGSKILNMDVTRSVDDPQPYYILEREQIARSGATNVQEFLKQQLPMDTTAVTSGNQSANFLGNASSFNLRGLGSNATLILIDGRRTAGVPSSPGNPSQADINGIPLAAIERIEVLPSSAAAIYGGAALGGVINVVLKHDYSGADLNLRYDNTLDADASIRMIDGSYGLALEEGRTHLLFGAHYVESGTLVNSDRPQLMRRGITTALDNNPGALASATTPFATGATPNIASSNGSALVLRPEYGGMSLNAPSTFISSGIGASTGAAALGADLLANAGQYRYDLPDTANSTGLRVSVIPPVKQASFYASLRREMTEKLEVFADFFTSRNTAESVFNPFGGTVTVPASSPVNPFTQAVRIAFPTTQLSTYSSETKTKRADAGLILRLPAGWTAEADYTWNRSSLEYGATFGTSTAIQAAIAAGTLNPFVDTVQNPLALTPYLGTGGYSAPSNDLQDINLRAGGPIGRLPAGAPYLTVGLGHRKESLGDSISFNSYPNFPGSNVSSLYLSQHQKTDSLYAEMRVPLVSEANAVAAVRSLDLQLAARVEKYSVSSRATTINLLNPGPVPDLIAHDYTSTNPTIALSYQPLQSVRFRTSYGTAFLPPSYTQLVPAVFFPNAPRNVIDPRRGGTLTTVPNFVRGGNVDLEPQDAKAFNLGVIWTPEFAEGLRLNLEYYRIEQLRVIVSPPFTQAGFQQVVNNENALPDYVVRDPVAPNDPYGVGTINTIKLIPVNGAKGVTDGFDLSANYRREVEGWGAWSFSTVGTYIQHYRIQYANAAEQELVNQVNNNGPLRLKANAVLQWEQGPWMLGWRTNFLGSYPQLTAYIPTQGSDHIPSQTYHTLFGQYRWSSDYSAFDGMTVQAGVKNLFNSTPPFDAAYAPYYYSPFGDPRLRAYWLSVSKHF